MLCFCPHCATKATDDALAGESGQKKFGSVVVLSTGDSHEVSVTTRLDAALCVSRIHASFVRQSTLSTLLFNGGTRSYAVM